RYYLVAPHYRSSVEFSEGALAEAATAYERIEGFVARAAERVGADAGAPLVCADFSAAMDDDLGTPAAVACIHEIVRSGNAALAAGDDVRVRGALGSVRAMLGILGLDPLSEPWVSRGSVPARVTGSGFPATMTGSGVVGALVEALLEQRTVARARKDYAASDAIRDQLAAAGVAVEDTAEGSRWTVRP
ncbi:MAG: cysteine--tRNA ligase, partial [Actinomycetota bacterium]|nr:cysteine--tRNA ligase [Actinomycetota bacterium]